MLLAGLAGPAFSARPVTVAQLQQVIAAAHDMPDAKMAQQLSELELTERMSAARLVRGEAEMPGPAARQALLAVSEASAFLDLPAEDIPAGAAPDGAAQDSLLALTMDYASKTIPKLPNFFATRDTTRFEDTPAEPPHNTDGHHQV